MDSNDLALLEKLGVEGVLAEMAKGEGILGRPGSAVREEINIGLRPKCWRGKRLPPLDPKREMMKTCPSRARP